MKPPKTVLATAYAVHPYKGSEDGMGWNFVYQIARFHRVIAITRENNRPHIEKYMLEHPDAVYANMQFLYFDLPYWMRFWKKGGRGAMLYYWLWQRGVVGFIQAQRLAFDIVHNLNFHNDWTPSYLWKLNKPFVWGPVGHHPPIPAHYLQPYRSRYWWQDRLGTLVKKVFWQGSLALKKTVQKADFICCMNQSVAGVLPLAGKPWQVIPSVATGDFGCPTPPVTSTFRLISAGRLLPLKGFDLSIRSFAAFLRQLPEPARAGCELVIVGSGPELRFYQHLCAAEGVAAHVRFVPWLERTELLKLYGHASAFLFPSHEGAGMVVAEALSFGLPVICLDNCGPGEFIDAASGIAVPQQGYAATVEALAGAIHRLYAAPPQLAAMRLGARKRFEEHFHWDRRGEQLHQIYQQL